MKARYADLTRPRDLEVESHQPHAGFTLTELLVVLAAVVLLALPLWAMTTKDRLAVQQIQCASNLKRLTMYALMYSSDTGSLLPYVGSSPWMGTLSRYDSQFAQTIVCPSAPPKAPVAYNNPGTCDTAWNWGGTTPILQGGYGLNGWMFVNKDYRPGHPGNYLFGKESSITFPKQTPFFVDCVWDDLWPEETDAPYFDLYTASGFMNPPAIARCVTPRHGGEDPANAPRNLTGGILPGAINMGLADGHVESVRLEKLWAYYWHLNWDPSLVPWPHPPPAP